MQNETVPQPIDLLMTQLGLTNADLVKASTEQLNFKMVNKGRSGRRISTNIQDKILNALLTLKPELKLKRKDLFRYEASSSLIEHVESALSLIGEKKIRYPQFIDRLVEGGVIGYKVEAGANRMVFFGVGGEAYVKQGPAISLDAPGAYDESAIRLAIADAQKEVIDHPVFLKRIHAAGVSVYEVNTRHRKIEYRGKDEQIHKEKIPLSSPPEAAPVQPAPKKVEKKPAKSKKNKSMTTKARVSFRKRQRLRKKRRRGR